MNGDSHDATDDAVDALKQAFAESALPPARRIERPYRPIGELTPWLVGLVVMQLVAASAGIVAVLVMRWSVGDKGAATFGVPAITSILAALLEGLGYVAALVVFCVWVHQAYSNLVVLGSRRVRFTPGWAVGYFFIPFVNLVRGVQVMRDLWIESQPLPIDGAAEATLVRRAPLVGWWWAMWILSMTSFRIVHGSSRIMLLHDDPMTKYALNVISGVLFIAVVRGIARRQRDQWDDLVRRQPVPAPTDQLR